MSSLRTIRQALKADIWSLFHCRSIFRAQPARLIAYIYGDEGILKQMEVLSCTAKYPRSMRPVVSHPLHLCRACSTGKYPEMIQKHESDMVVIKLSLESLI